MPLYEYKCAACGEVFEIIQKFSDEPLHEHPGCGGAVERLVSVSALQFKGSGWYVTDYGKNGSSPVKEKPKGDSTDGKTDNKKADGSKAAATPAKETKNVTKSE
ncbi:MAG: FmdB family zinc ribbon protein [Bryobacteraceae bacterium]|jgi:putative FmdB family regulatory protein